MGNVLRVLNAGAEHVLAQSKVDAGRITQKAFNEAQLSLAESKRIIQSANNSASDIYAVNSKKFQDVYNAAQDSYASNALTLQTISNNATEAAAAGGRNIQSAINTRAAAIAAGQKSIQDAQNASNKQLAQANRDLEATYNEHAILLAEAKRVVQSSRNERVAQDSSTALWGQSLKNQRILDAAGKEVGRITEDVVQVQDRTQRGRIFDRIEASQVLGAAVAQASSLGVGGTSVDMLRGALSLQEGLKEATLDDQLRQQTVRAYKERGNAMAGAVGALDFTPIVANMDREAIAADQKYGVYSDNQDYTPVFAEFDFNPIIANKDYSPIMAQKDYSPIIAERDFSVFTPDQDYTVYVDHKKMSGLQQFVTLAAATGATYFGGPAAGSAVVDASLAMYDMSNANYSAAQKGLNNAFNSALKGFDTYRAGASKGTKGKAWGAQIFTKKPSTSGAKLGI